MTRARLVLAGYLTVASISGFAESAEVLNYFPQCDYQILDTHTYKHKIERSKKDSVFTQEQLSKTMTLLTTRMKDRAIELKADGILLIDRKIEGIEEKTWTKNQGDHVLVKYTAEFIKQCQAIQSRSKKPTPYDKSGAPQKQIQLGKVGGWQQQIEFVMPSNRKRDEPELTSSSVTIDTGLYGVALGSSIEQVVNTFGTPTLSVRLSSQQQLIAYGRRHWLWFSDGILGKVATDSGLFATEFTNLMAFDDRFEVQDWVINGTIRQNSVYQAEMATISQKGKTLKILTDTFIDKNSDESLSKVIGFELYLNRVEFPNQPEIADTNRLQDTIDGYIQSKKAELLLTDLNMEPIARVWRDATTELLLFDHHMVIEVTGKSVSAVNYLENAFDIQQEVNWQFNRVEQGQTLQDVMSLFGDDAFEFNGVVEFGEDKYQMELYFAEVDGQMRLYAAEIAIY